MSGKRGLENHIVIVNFFLTKRRTIFIFFSRFERFIEEEEEEYFPIE
jgi:hypothetical protein